MKLPRLQLRKRVGKLVERTNLASSVLHVRGAVGSPLLTVLTWHRIRDTADSGGFDDGVVDATTHELDEQLGVLARRCSFVGIDEVLAWTRGAALPRNPVMVSFDDAYKECVDVALPILKRHQARATFFVSTGHVAERRVFWWDRTAYVLRRARVQRGTFEGIELALADDAERQTTERRVLRAIKDRPGLDIEAFLRGLGEACKVDWTSELERELADRLICTWDDLRTLRAAGMDIQSHTRTHRVMQTLGPKETADELQGSREDLEAVLREPVRALAYPTGRPVDPGITTAVRAAGYELAFENAGGVNARFRTPDPLRLRRVPMVPGRSAATFESVVALPFLG